MLQEKKDVQLHAATQQHQQQQQHYQLTATSEPK
jgi:hypothetical protein